MFCGVKDISMLNYPLCSLKTPLTTYLRLSPETQSFQTNLLAMVVVWRLAWSAHDQDILSLIPANSKSFHENLKLFYVSALKESLAVLPGELICLNMHSPGMKKLYVLSTLI